MWVSGQPRTSLLPDRPRRSSTVTGGLRALRDVLEGRKGRGKGEGKRGWRCPINSVGRTGMNRIIVALREEIRMDETQEKSVIESDSKEKIGNAIDQLDLLHRLFINHDD